MHWQVDRVLRVHVVQACAIIRDGRLMYRVQIRRGRPTNHGHGWGLVDYGWVTVMVACE